MRLSVTTGLIAAVAFTTQAGAQTAGAFMNDPAFQDPPPARCVSTLEMQRCAAHDLRVADARMSAQYAAVRERLRPAAQRALLSEQRVWLRSRDRDCVAKGQSGGSMASLNVARCWVNVTNKRAAALTARPPQGSNASAVLPASAFVGRWRGGEGTFMKITRRGSGFAIDNQWGLDPDMHGIYSGSLTPGGLSFRRNGTMQIARPSAGDAINLSALRGKRDCLMVSVDEGYCRY